MYLWYHYIRNRDKILLLQGWDTFIGNIKNVGRDACLDKLTAARNRFEQNSAKWCFV